MMVFMPLVLVWIGQMTPTQVVETSVTNTCSLSKDYPHLDDQTKQINSPSLLKVVSYFLFV